MLACRPPYAYCRDPADQIKQMNEKHDMLWYSDVQAGGQYPKYKLAEYRREGIMLEDSPEEYALLKITALISSGFPVMEAMPSVRIQI